MAQAEVNNADVPHENGFKKTGVDSIFPDAIKIGPMSPTTPGFDRGLGVNIIARVEEWNRSLPPHAARRKYQLLAESPLKFFEGTNHLFWAEYCADERMMRFSSPEMRTWLCGDCHIGSFSAYGNEKEGPMYGICKFDEAVTGDYQFDLWRLAASVVLVAASNGGPLQSEEVQRSAVLALAKSYLRAVVNFKGARDDGGVAASLQALKSYTAGNMKGRLVRFLSVVERELSRKRMLKRWCTEENGQRRFMAVEGKLEPSPPDERQAIISAFEDFDNAAAAHEGEEEEHEAGGEGDVRPHHHIRIRDVGRWLVADVGETGMAQFVLLVESDDGGEQLLLLKMQRNPTGYHFMTLPEREAYRAEFQNEAHRHAESCKLLSSSIVSYNGWIEIMDIHPAANGYYSIQDLSPYSEPYPYSTNAGETKAKLKALTLDTEAALIEMSEIWGRILADRHAHAALELEGNREGSAIPKFCTELTRLTMEEVAGFQELVWDIARESTARVTQQWTWFRNYAL